MRNMNRITLFTLLILCLSNVMADDRTKEEWASNQAVGTTFPTIDAMDQFGEHWTNQNMAARNGFIFFFNRSANWWSYCKKQLVELSENNKAFADLGVRVMVMTYETREQHMKFSKQYDIKYSILSDPESHHIRVFGIVNPKFGPDSMAYGVPYPGVFVVDKAGIIRAKFAEQSYRDRPIIEDLLDAARGLSKWKC